MTTEPAAKRCLPAKKRNITKRRQRPASTSHQLSYSVDQACDSCSGIIVAARLRRRAPSSCFLRGRNRMLSPGTANAPRPLHAAWIFPLYTGRATPHTKSGKKTLRTEQRCLGARKPSCNFAIARSPDIVAHMPSARGAKGLVDGLSLHCPGGPDSADSSNHGGVGYDNEFVEHEVTGARSDSLGNRTAATRVSA